jgi:hypothetical protein
VGQALIPATLRPRHPPFLRCSLSEGKPSLALTTASGPSEVDRLGTRQHADCNSGTRRSADPSGSHRDPAETLAANGRIGGGLRQRGRRNPARVSGTDRRPVPVPDAGRVAIAGSNPRPSGSTAFSQDRRSVRLSDAAVYADPVGEPPGRPGRPLRRKGSPTGASP